MSGGGEGRLLWRWRRHDTGTFLVDERIDRGGDRIMLTMM